MKSCIALLVFLFSIPLLAQEEGGYHLDKEFEISSSGTIELTSSDAKVTITGSDRKNVHLKVDRTVVTKGLYFGSDEFAMEIDNSNGNLRIREKSRSSSYGIVGYYNEDYEIKIEAPEGVSILVKGDDGDYWIKNINGSVAMGVDDGDIDLVGCKGTKFRFRMDDGNLTMDQGRGSIEINIDDGDVRIKNGNFSQLTADIDDGNFMIETSLIDNGEYKIDGEDGSISIVVTNGGGQFDIRHDDTRVIAEGNFDVKEKSESFTSLKLPNGTAKVNIQADDARVRVSKPE